jgi:hypothetical protein
MFLLGRHLLPHWHWHRLLQRNFQLTKELSSHEDPDELRSGADRCFAALVFLQTTSATTPAIAPAIAPAISPSSKKASDITPALPPEKMSSEVQQQPHLWVQKSVWALRNFQTLGKATQKCAQMHHVT